MARSKVAVVSATPETVLEDYARALELAGLPRIVARSQSSLALLLDLRWSRFQPGTGPTPWQLDAVLRTLAEQGVDPEQIQLVARGGPDINPATAIRRYNLAPILRERGLAVGDLSSATTRRAPEQRLPELEQWHGGAVELSTLSSERTLITLSGLSTHVQFGMAGAVGAVAAEFLELDLLREHSRAPDLLAEAFAFAQEVHPQLFAVLDATTCGLGSGPRRVRPSAENLLIASSDPVAADAVAARVLDLDPRRIPYLSSCQDRGLGSVNLEEIEFVGEMPSTLERNLHAPPTLSLGERIAVLGSGRALAAPRRRARSLLRDALWYPLRGRRWRRLWAPTPWGRLFEDYAKRSNT